MSYSQEHNVMAKLEAILADVPDAVDTHHLGRSFLTAYQIAIEFARRHPDDVKNLGHPIGGQGSGVHYTIASYVSSLLSLHIRDNPNSTIEGGFLSNWHLNDISFKHEKSIITSSLTNSNYTLSMFRLKV